MIDESSSSEFMSPTAYSDEWRDIMLVHRRSHTLIYTASRYGRRFVLKALPPEDAELTDYRLQQEREFQLGIQLVHPNIAATYSLETVEGIGRCIVQEWVDGVTLGEWMTEKPSRAARERVFGQLLDALEYVHGLQLVHHDLKADNILITRNGTNVKLIDFGLSATDATLSPVPNNTRADIEALGRLLVVLLPHQRLLARRCRNGKPTTIADIRHFLQRRRVVLTCLFSLLLVLMTAIFGALYYRSWTRHIVSKTEQHLNNEVDTTEIYAIIDSIYRPVYDSLHLPDSRYQDIARTYIFCMPKPMQTYNRLVARYPVGSVQYSSFTEAWIAIQNRKTDALCRQIAHLPYSKIAYAQGDITYEECMRIEKLQLAIIERHKDMQKFK